jgi:hypothetical protein
MWVSISCWGFEDSAAATRQQFKTGKLFRPTALRENAALDPSVSNLRKSLPQIGEKVAE